MSRRNPLLLLVLAMALAGCGKPHSVVGKWEIQGAAASWPGSTAKMTFSAGEKVVSELEGPIENSGLKAVMTVKIEGTYTYRDGVLSSHFTKVDLDVSGLTPEQKAVFLMAADTQKPKMLEGLNADKPQRLKWLTPDKFEFHSDPNLVATFVRIQ